MRSSVWRLSGGMTGITMPEHETTIGCFMNEDQLITSTNNQSTQSYRSEYLHAHVIVDFALLHHMGGPMDDAIGDLHDFVQHLD
jgi:hypothetical protein